VTAVQTQQEEGLAFNPRYDRDGLIPAIVTDAGTGVVLMFAYMNAEALAATLGSGQAHFFSRSRNRLWKKGESSGNVLQVSEIRTDCDQDVLWLRASLHGEAVCHTGRVSCFYRRVVQKPSGVTELVFIDGNDSL
jgi:phosphoribosyl-AMP cyclohydrolase